MSFKIIADSSADLLHSEGTDFESVPLKIITDEKEYIDDGNLNLNEMITDLRQYKGASHSSCPNAAEWKSAFKGADNIFCVTITGNLSGSAASANMAVNEYIEEHPDKQGCVLDTLSTGPENALIIEKLQELIAKGFSFNEIKKQITEYMKTTHLFFSLESLRNLANNGRVSPAVAKIAGILGIRVVGKASSEGTLELTNKVRGEEKALNTIVSNMLSLGFNGGKVRIHHCQNEKGAQALKTKLLALFPQLDVCIQATRALCSFYAEKGGLLIGFEA